CVTINIYFPAEKVDAVAEEIVKEIRERSGEKRGPQKNDESSLFRERFLALFQSHAWADDITSVSNPTIRALKERIIGRHIQWKPYAQKGMLKEGSDGYVALGNTKGLGLKEKRNLKNLVDAENRDRKKLYAAVAKALKIDASQVNKIAERFAKKWRE
ncbi:MAG: YdbL family protein, partial [Deltaproteobacteria bacterium]|nr:YdbL family protein [Deltaproteobacteria bacterium]